MRTIYHPICRVLRFVGIGLMLSRLFGGPRTASPSDVELFVSQHDWSAQFPWGPQDYRGTRDPGGRTPGDTGMIGHRGAG